MERSRVQAPLSPLPTPRISPLRLRQLWCVGANVSLVSLPPLRLAPTLYRHYHFRPKTLPFPWWNPAAWLQVPLPAPRSFCANGASGCARRHSAPRSWRYRPKAPIGRLLQLLFRPLDVPPAYSQPGYSPTAFLQSARQPSKWALRHGCQPCWYRTTRYPVWKQSLRLCLTDFPPQSDPIWSPER